MAVRRNVYEKQARLSVALAAIGAFCTLAGAAMILQAFDRESFQVVYNPHGARLVGIAGALLAGLGSGGFGFLLGLLSAGQKTNTLNRLSWTGFFASAGVIALALSCAVFFFFTQFAYEPKADVGLGG